MARQSETKIYKTDSRHTLYLKNDIVNDSNFPFQIGQTLIVRIEGDKLIIERRE